MWGDIAIAFLLAFITAFVITPYTMRIAKNERRINTKPMPRLGRNSCNFRIPCVMYLLNYYNDYRKKDRFRV